MIFLVKNVRISMFLKAPCAAMCYKSTIFKHLFATNVEQCSSWKCFTQTTWEDTLERRPTNAGWTIAKHTSGITSPGIITSEPTRGWKSSTVSSVERLWWGDTAWCFTWEYTRASLNTSALAVEKDLWIQKEQTSASTVEGIVARHNIISDNLTQKASVAQDVWLFMTIRTLMYVQKTWKDAR